MKTRFPLLLVALALSIFGCYTPRGSTAGLAEPGPARQSAESLYATYFVGGLVGMTSLENPANTAAVRASGGGLYIHNSAWTKLNPEQRRAILTVFQGRPIGIELGFIPDSDLWPQLFQREYLAYGITPTFITVNAFDKDNVPTVAQWLDFMQRMRAHGTPASTLIFATFEYQNFGQNLPTLAQHKVSETPSFQQMITASGGLTLDTPPGYALFREQAYRDWVADAVQWTRMHGLVSIVIISPHNSAGYWAQDTQRYVQYLHAHNALPTTFACENYEGENNPDYPNPVGNENDANTSVGNCWMLEHQLLPAMR